MAALTTPADVDTKIVMRGLEDRRVPNGLTHFVRRILVILH